MNLVSEVSGREGVWLRERERERMENVSGGERKQKRRDRGRERERERLTLSSKPIGANANMRDYGGRRPIDMISNKTSEHAKRGKVQ